MRIISGRFRSRRLHAPRDADTTRPIPDRVKESLFNMLRGNLDGAVVLDCFAGTGSFGLEALSRGASRVVFVERDRSIANVLERNIADLGVEDECEMIVADALGPAVLHRCPRRVDLIFMDPPYELARDEQGWARIRTQVTRLLDHLADDGFALIRTPHPLLHKIEPPAAVPDEHNLNVQIVVESADDLDESVDAEFERLFGLSSAKPTFLDADLSVEGALGPETRDYGTMAVHIYSRAKRSDDPV